MTTSRPAGGRRQCTAYPESLWIVFVDEPDEGDARVVGEVLGEHVGQRRVPGQDRLGDSH
ncbi:MAG: hypothetical protein IPN45_04800 [Actinomycetales bacterium]|nr:hypothetical protein [Actinomycetales bacterium]